MGKPKPKWNWMAIETLSLKANKPEPNNKFLLKIKSDLDAKKYPETVYNEIKHHIDYYNRAQKIKDSGATDAEQKEAIKIAKSDAINFRNTIQKLDQWSYSKIVMSYRRASEGRTDFLIPNIKTFWKNLDDMIELLDYSYKDIKLKSGKNNELVEMFIIDIVEILQKYGITIKKYETNLGYKIIGYALKSAKFSSINIKNHLSKYKL